MDKLSEMNRSIRKVTRKEGTVGRLFGQTFKVGQYGKDVTLYNMENSIEIQDTNVYASFGLEKLNRAEKDLMLLDLEFADKLREGDCQDVRRLQVDIEKAKMKVKETQKRENMRYSKTVNALDNILYLLFKPSSSPRYVPSKR